MFKHIKCKKKNIIDKRSTDLIFTNGSTGRWNIRTMSKHTIEGSNIEIHVFNKLKYIIADFYEPHLPM